MTEQKNKETETVNIPLSAGSSRLYTLPTGVETRWASPENPRGLKGQAATTNAGRKGRAYLPVKAGDSLVLAEETATSGTIHRIWMTMNDRSPQMLRGLRIEFTWDGADSPAISVPIGDFFGLGLGRMVPFQSALFSNPEGRSFNCCVSMPFKNGMKVSVHNESGTDLLMLFYDVNYTVGDPHTDDTLYFHAHWRHENPTSMRRDYEILPRITGRGRFLGSNIGVIANTERYARSWWGEGEVKIFLDGDTQLPTLCGTGTEDYIGTAWGQGAYNHLYQGCPVADEEHFQYCFYRYHLPDPVWFHRDVRVTIQQIGCWDPESKPFLHARGRDIIQCGPGDVVADLSPEGGSLPHATYEREDDWSSCAYFYLDRPVNALPPLEPLEARIAGL